MVKGIAEKSPHLKHLIVVRGNAPEGTIAFSRLIEDIRLDDSSTEYLSKLGPSPEDVMHLGPTGGTTGVPKLVPKTHNAHMSCCYYLSRASERDLKEVSLSPGCSSVECGLHGPVWRENCAFLFH